MSHPLTDIVLPVHNALEYVAPCVASLYEHTKDFRLILVDDYSNEDTRAFLYGQHCTGRDRRNLYVRTNRQSWFTRASNTGLRLVETEKAALINSDLVFNIGWLEELYDVWADFESKTGRRVGLVGDWGDPNTEKRYEETLEPNYVTGHAVLFSMQALQEASVARGDPGRYLNELRQDSIHINSDRFVCYELNKLGYATVIAYKTPLGHYGGKSWNYNLGHVSGVRLEDVD
jgi:glycosyltransferase involved in cell wall biosynthesis